MSNRFPAEHIINEFVELYMFPKPYCEYVNSCGISTIGIAEWQKIRKDKSLEEVCEEMRARGENPDEFCIKVGFRKEPPQNLVIPENFKDIRVVTHVTGEIIFA